MSQARRSSSKELPARSSTDDEWDDESARQERIYIDNTAGYLRASRSLSTELHGFVYTTEPQVDPEGVSRPHSSMQQADGQQIHSGSSAQSADAGVTLDVEGATANKQAAADDNSRVRELLEPMGGPGQEQLVLTFERLSVWAPVMPKKPSILTRAWKKTVTCGKAESNPQRQILFDVTGQVGLSSSCSACRLVLYSNAFDRPGDGYSQFRASHWPLQDFICAATPQASALHESADGTAHGFESCSFPVHGCLPGSCMPHLVNHQGTHGTMTAIYVLECLQDSQDVHITHCTHVCCTEHLHRGFGGRQHSAATSKMVTMRHMWLLVCVSAGSSR